MGSDIGVAGRVGDGGASKVVLGVVGQADVAASNSGCTVSSLSSSAAVASRTGAEFLHRRLLAYGLPRPLYGALDPGGDEGVRQVARRQRVEEGVRQVEQRGAGDRPVTVRAASQVVRPSPATTAPIRSAWAWKTWGLAAESRIAG